jgi:hypothetical protein
MLRAHPEYRPVVAGAAVAVALIAVMTCALVFRGGHAGDSGGRPQPVATHASGPAAAVPTAPVPTPLATPAAAPAAAIATGTEFALAYVEYDYRSGPPTGDAVKPYATARLFWQLTQGGQDTAGNPAPWTAVSVGSDDVVTATVVRVAGQLADADDAAVQVVVSERDVSSGAAWSGTRQEDLGLIRSGPQWLVDQVSQVSPEAS